MEGSRRPSSDDRPRRCGGSVYRFAGPVWKRTLRTPNIFLSSQCATFSSTSAPCASTARLSSAVAQALPHRRNRHGALELRVTVASEARSGQVGRHRRTADSFRTGTSRGQPRNELVRTPARFDAPSSSAAGRLRWFATTRPGHLAKASHRGHLDGRHPHTGPRGIGGRLGLRFGARVVNEEATRHGSRRFDAGRFRLRSHRFSRRGFGRRADRCSAPASASAGARVGRAHVGDSFPAGVHRRSS